MNGRENRHFRQRRPEMGHPEIDRALQSGQGWIGYETSLRFDLHSGVGHRLRRSCVLTARAKR
jgi:hypothetical protein